MGIFQEGICGNISVFLERIKKKNERIVANGRNLVPVPIKIDLNIRETLASIRQDFVTNIVSDKTISEYMRRNYHSKGDNQIYKKIKFEITEGKLQDYYKQSEI